MTEYSHIFSHNRIKIMFGTETTQKKGLQVLLKSSYVGLARAAVGLPFQHPFDAIKTNMQALSKQTSAAISQIYSRKGIRGFYSGFLVNTARVMTKQIYRWPLMIGLTSFYKNTLNISEIKSSSLTGLSMAVIEVGIICPFERMKCWLMTSQKNATIRSFLFSGEIFSLFKGFTPVFCKQTISWVTFLSTTSFFKDLAKKYYNTDKLNQFQIFMTSLPVSIVNTLFVMPVDFVKTQYQKSSGGDSSTIKKILWRRYLKNGFKGFYIGWQVKLVQYTINSFFTVGILQSLMRDYESSL